MANRILLDNSEGNVIGWNPNGNRMSFTIFMSNLILITSTVIVNTFQSNFVVCNVNYMYDEHLKSIAQTLQQNGGQLHYTIVNLPSSDEGAQATVAQQVADQIAQRENAANQTQLR